MTKNNFNYRGSSDFGKETAKLFMLKGAFRDVLIVAGDTKVTNRLQFFLRKRQSVQCQQFRLIVDFQ